MLQSSLSVRYIMNYKNIIFIRVFSKNSGGSIYNLRHVFFQLVNIIICLTVHCYSMLTSACRKFKYFLIPDLYRAIRQFIIISIHKRLSTVTSNTFSFLFQRRSNCRKSRMRNNCQLSGLITVLFRIHENSRAAYKTVCQIQKAGSYRQFKSVNFILNPDIFSCTIFHFPGILFGLFNHQSVSFLIKSFY